MTDQHVLLQLTENCDIFFEDSLISKELIVQRYANFFASLITSKERSSSVVLHTGSVCFDIVSFIMAALACVSMDQTDPDTIIASLNVGDLVLYKNQRHRWHGIDTTSGIQYMKLQQDGRGKDGATTHWLPFDRNKGQIKPYCGSSEVTDGRGIRRQKSSRSEFIAFVTGKNKSNIPSITGVSAVIVADRAVFDRIQKGLRIQYGEGKSIGLLDIAPASYYTDVDEPYQFGSNPSKAEPVLKIAGKVSVARDLVLDKHSKRTVGLMVLGTDAVSKGSSDLMDLLSRKSLKFTHISMHIDSEIAEDYIGEESSAVFACTKEFLLRHSLPATVQNPLTAELEKQIDNIINNEIMMKIIDGGCLWETYRKIRNALFVIKQSEWDEEYKKSFIVPSHSLLNLFATAVFPMKVLEQAVADSELQLGVSSPSTRIEELCKLAEKAHSLKSQCSFVVDALNSLYMSILSDSPKYQALKQMVQGASREKIAIIIPKAYYADILIKEDLVFSRNSIYIMTANRFDASQSYDKVIVIGDFSGKRFDALKCRAAADIIVLLYECETHGFKCRYHKAAKFEKKLNTINGLDDGFSDDGTKDVDADEDAVERFVSESLDLEEYIDALSQFDVRKFAVGASAGSGNAPTSEVSASGRFVGGEQIMFSKYYKAVVYNPANTKEPISETDVEKLSAGDKLIFTKRDDFTRNIVDSIYEALQTSGKLSKDVLDATEKAQWWKRVLRDYQLTNHLSYRQLAKELNRFGCSLTEVSIRQWLVEESHIVGPREEITLRQIAEMTQDTYLLNNTPEYFNACRTVRRQRKKILELIGKAIEDKLRGHQPSTGSELEVVYNNVESLSETLELEAITLLDEPVTVPVNLINKPISDMEVAL